MTDDLIARMAWALEKELDLIALAPAIRDALKTAKLVVEEDWTEITFNNDGTPANVEECEEMLLAVPGLTFSGLLRKDGSFETSDGNEAPFRPTHFKLMPSSVPGDG